MKKSREVIIKSECFTKMKELTINSKEKETGGLMYGRMNPRWLRIYDISDPGSNSIRNKNSIIFDMDYLEDYSNKKISKNYFIVGTWHSHPPNSTLYPSSIDKETMLKLARKYKYLYPPIFAIVCINKGKFDFQFYEPNDEKINKVTID